MTTMNFDSVQQQQSFGYPHFHDTKSTRRTNKDVEIDNSVYHLLSLYLNADALDKSTSLLALPLPAIQHRQNNNNINKHSPQSPYWRTKSNCTIRIQRTWLGEEEHHKQQSQQELLLLQNTMKNSTTNNAIVYNDDCCMTTTKNKKRSKSVSFNETVTIISQDNQSSSQLKQQQQQDHHHHMNETLEDDDESIFVDALENLDC